MDILKETVVQGDSPANLSIGVQGASPVNLAESIRVIPPASSQSNSIPVNNEQKNLRTVISNQNPNKRRHVSEHARTEYVEAATLFSGAEATTKYYLFLNKEEEEEVNFADLNFKKRLDALAAILGNSNFKMKKFKTKKENEYKLGVCVDVEEDMNKLLKIKTIAGCKVTAEENTAKNSIKGLIIDHEDDLINMDKRELLAAVSSKGIKDIVRYGTSKVIEIRFGGQTKPDKVYFWKKLSFPVQPYIEEPTRCFKCQYYGHMSRSCRNDYACYNCGLVYTDRSQHTPKECINAKCCVNCKGPHASGHKKSCEIHKKERKWAAICFNQNIKRSEAKERYPSGDVPKYSAAARQRSQDPQQGPSNPAPVEEMNTQMTAHMNTQVTELTNKVESLENMFRTFMTAVSGGSIKAGNDDQIGNGATAVVLAQLQKEMNEMKEEQEIMRRERDGEKAKYAEAIKKGNDAFELLKQKHEDTIKENKELREQVRELMKTKKKTQIKGNIDDSMDDTTSTISPSDLHNRNQAAGNITQACRAFAPSEKGSGSDKDSNHRGESRRGGHVPAKSQQ